MAEHTKFSHTANWLGLPSLCPVLSSNHVWELAVLLELVPPVSPSSPPPPPSRPPSSHLDQGLTVKGATRALGGETFFYARTLALAHRCLPC